MHGDRVESAAVGTINVNTGVPVTPDTLFQIGSITKVYTTTLVMQLVEEGRIELDAPAVTYLPGLRFGDAALTPSVTIRHLLTHTSGVDGDFFEDFGRGDDCVEKYVAACEGLAFLFPPGQMWSYSNAGFVVLGRIIEVLTGHSWDHILRSRLLEPLGVERTITLPEEALRHNTAAGHYVGPDLGISLAPRWTMPRSVGPAGATPCSTVGDLLTFARMHMDGGVAKDGARILAETSVRVMQEPQSKLPDAPGYSAQHWGLGWMLFDWDGRRVFGHDGGTIGQASSLRVLPDERFAVAILTNSIGGGLLTGRIMRWLFQSVGVEVPPLPKPPETPATLDLEPYAGVYESNGYRVTVSLEDGQLRQLMEATTGADVPLPPQATTLVPVDESLFIFQDPWTRAFQPAVFSDFRNGRPEYHFMGRVARRKS
jgi:CubicO group peptidase (beta-lactamase class C family)